MSTDPLLSAVLVREIEAKYGVGRHFLSAYAKAMPTLIPSFPTPAQDAAFKSESLEQFREATGSSWKYVDYALSCISRAQTFVDRVNAFSPLPKEGRSLDLGCAYAGMLVHFGKMGFDPHGIELSPALAALGNQNLCDLGMEPRVQSGSLYDLLPNMGSFDIITCNDVIEHLPDPKCALSLMARALTRDGTLIIDVPNGKSIFNVTSDPHYRLFGASALPRSLAMHYVMEALTSTGYGMGEYYPLDWYLNVLREAGLQVSYQARNWGERFDSLPEYLEALLGAFKNFKAKTPTFDAVLLAEVDRHLYTYISDLACNARRALDEGKVQPFMHSYVSRAWTIVATTTK